MTRGTRAVIGLVAVVLLAAAGAAGWLVATRPYHHQAAATAAVHCGLITCSHGRAGQACVSSGFPGHIVIVAAGESYVRRCVSSPAGRTAAVHCGLDGVCGHGQQGQPCAMDGIPGHVDVVRAAGLYRRGTRLCVAAPTAARHMVHGRVFCGSLEDPTCKFGSDGQRCVTGGTDGIVVTDTPGHLLCDINGPVTAPTATTPPGPLLSFTCNLVWISGGTTYPDTRHGYNAAYQASGGVPDSGRVVVATNTSGTGGVLQAFNVETDDQAGTLVSIVTVSDSSGTIDGNAGFGATADDGGTLPLFIAPGESDTYVIDYAAQGVGVTMDFADYLAATCQVPEWYHP